MLATSSVTDARICPPHLKIYPTTLWNTELVFVFGSCNCDGHFQALVPISWRLRVPKIIIIVNELLTGLPIKGGTFETQLYGEITLSNWRKLKLLNKIRELDGIVNSKPLVFRQCHRVECQTLDEYRTIGVMTKYVITSVWTSVFRCH